MDQYDFLPGLKKNRIIGQKYIYSNRIITWNGKTLNCEHDKYYGDCQICNKLFICEHNKKKRNCVQCNPDKICDHLKHKYRCIDCRYGKKCIHNIFTIF